MSFPEDRPLRSLHEEAEKKRRTIENSSSTLPNFQENVLAAIQLYEQCVAIADRLAIFSPNESLEDISTTDLPYLLLNYWLAELQLRVNREARTSTLQAAQLSYDRYLRQQDQYDMLNKSDAALLETYREAPRSFSVVSSIDPAAKRDSKIKRFKEEKAMRQKLEHLRSNPSVLQNDEGAVRQLHLTQIAYCTHQTFQSLESIAQEFHILSLAPAHAPPTANQRAPDARERITQANDGYSERLDGPLRHLSAGLRGPILDKQGKPLQPFTLTSKRQDIASGVFRPGHSLPTMSIDEYLEEERRRGGMIEGGGPQSGIRPMVDEDDMEAADRETMKARDWDEFVEANPKGSGNTINRG